MHQLFTYEERRHLDAHHAAHASDPVLRVPPRRHVVRGWVHQLRDRYRVEVIDLRTPAERGLPDHRVAAQARDRPLLPEFID